MLPGMGPTNLPGQPGGAHPFTMEWMQPKDPSGQMNEHDDKMVDFMSGIPSAPGPRAMGLSGEPTPESMRLAEDAIRWHRIIFVEKFYSKTFNLFKEDENEAYCELYKELYRQVGEQKVHIITNINEMVPCPVNGHWRMVHLEWIEYVMQEKDISMKPRE